MTIPSPEDIGKILTAADMSFQPFVALCAFAGLRLGEAAAVKLDDINFLKRTLTISRQVQRAGKDQVEIRPPKYGSERVVFIPESLVNMLAAHVERGVRPEGWLFVGAAGNPPHQNSIGYWWRKTLRDAKLSGIKLHDLRHFYASGLIAQGCDVVTVQRPRPRQGDHHLEHLFPLVANRRRAHQQSRRGHDENRCRKSCGLCADSTPEKLL